MKSLRARIEFLEEQAGIGREPLTIIMRRFVAIGDGELYGYRYQCGFEEIDVHRKPGESEDALLERAEDAAPIIGGIAVLHELRR